MARWNLWMTALLVSGATPGLAKATEYQPALGKGVNFSETKTYATCLVGIKTETETKNPALTRLYNETKIESRRQLERSLEINASISAKGLWGSAGGSVSHFSDVKMSSEAFYWLVDAKYELSSSSVRTNDAEFDLTPRAKEILRRFGVEAFYQACGTHFYAGRKVGARYSLLYEFKSTEDRSVENLRAAASYGGFGISAKTDFKEYVDLASKSSSLTVYSYIVGGDDTIKDYAKNPEELEAQLQRLRENLYREEKGVVIEWYMGNYDQFPEVLTAKQQAPHRYFTDQFRNDSLSRYYELYSRNNARIDELTLRLTRSLGDEPYFIYSADKLASIRSTIQRIDEQNELIQRRAIGCIVQDTTQDSGQVCKTSDLQDLVYSVPEPDKDLSAFGQWTFYPMFTRADDGFSTFNLMGEPAGDFRPRLFVAGERMFSTPTNAAYALAPNLNGVTGQIRIGDVTPVIDPRTGKYRPAICVGDYAKVCNIRVVESPTTRLEDGYPASKVQLTLFNPRGYIHRRYEFLMQR